ncbi:MAG TPA: RIP metalloprotease RseP [Crinalium sp.]|jgi:membrane-associated protease RseP (regulator of RpoE activity)
MSVLAAIAVLALLIVVHEMGHFLAARLQGIHVNRFSIGFGPILWKYQGPETEYAIRAIPLGGFVGFPDDDPDSDIPENDPDLLHNRPILDRAIVISAGVIANLIFAYFVFVVQFGALGVPEATQPGVLIPQLASSSVTVAADAGIKSGDVILSANGTEFGRSLDSREALKNIIENSPGKPVDLEVQRGGETLSIEVVPQRNADNKGQIGVSLDHNGAIQFRRSNIFETFGLAAQEFQNVLVMTVNGFVMLITNFGEVANQVAGPVKIVEQGAKFAQANAASLFPFTALISINLAIINILPLPALDGGQLVFLLIEALRGKPLPSRIQENVMQTGLVLLLGLGIFLIVRDTTQLEIFRR